MSAAFFQLAAMANGEQDIDLGTGINFGKIVLILTGVSSLLACLLTLAFVALIRPKYLHYS